VLLFALWAQLFYSASYAWLHGEYYDYGWYVPPLAFWFFYRRWRDWPLANRRPLPGWAVVGGLVMLAVMLAPMRTLLRTDPSWTTPMWGQVMIVCTATFLIVWRMSGRKALLGLLPVVLFALTAVPMLGSLERILVETLTHRVLEASSWIFALLGRPVTVLGANLEMGGQVVEVSEGCSGIRSTQSLLMASLCIGEWLMLRTGSRFALVGVGFLAAWVTNVARAFMLAQIRFDHGLSAFDKAHDLAGMVAFVVGTLILLAAALAMDSKRKGARMVRKQVAASTT
jgi:exosortase